MTLLSADDLFISLHETLADISASEWDALNIDDYPFASYAFLHALEISGCVGGDSGWRVWVGVLRVCSFGRWGRRPGGGGGARGRGGGGGGLGGTSCARAALHRARSSFGQQ